MAKSIVSDPELAQATYAWLGQNPNATAQDALAQLQSIGYTPEDIQRATGQSVSQLTGGASSGPVVQAVAGSGTNSDTSVLNLAGIKQAVADNPGYSVQRVSDPELAQATYAWLGQNPGATMQDALTQLSNIGYTAEDIQRATGKSVAELTGTTTGGNLGIAGLEQAASGLSAGNTAGTSGGTNRVSDTELSQATYAWLAQNPGATMQDALTQLQSIGYTPEDIQRATGKSVAELTGTTSSLNTTGTGTGKVSDTELSQATYAWLAQNPGATMEDALRQLISIGYTEDDIKRATGKTVSELVSANTRPPITTLPPISLAPPVTGEGISTQFIREAPEIEAYKLGLLQEAKRLYESPIDYNQLDYRVAAPSEGFLTSYDIAQQGIGAYQPFIQQGAGTLAQGQGLTSQAATMGQLGLGAYLSATGQYNPAQTAQFMNPYQQLVTDQALREIRRQADIAGQGQAAQAVRAGAFGGTREGVQRAEMERNTQDIMSQRIAQDLAQNYAQAQQASQAAYEAQQQRAIAAGQGIGSLTGTYGSLGSQLGQLGVQQAALGQAAQQGVTSDVGMMNALGMQQQQYAQALLDAERMSSYQRQFDPYTRLGFVSDIYKGAPSTQSAVTATTAQQPSMFQQLVGGVTSGIATAAGAQKLGLF